MPDSPSIAGATLLALLLSVQSAWAQTHPLNDTGQVQCVDTANALTACTIASTGNFAALPGQDGRYGRDAAQGAGAIVPPKVGGGEAGFDFSALAADGSPAAPGLHWCVYDNVTGLLWSTETIGVDGITHAAAMAAGASYDHCGHATGWRLPTRRELLSIVHRGRSGPAIEPAYFPATLSDVYWTADDYAPDPLSAWVVEFDNGNTSIGFKEAAHAAARLVRDGR